MRQKVKTKMHGGFKAEGRRKVENGREMLVKVNGEIGDGKAI